MQDRVVRDGGGREEQKKMGTSWRSRNCRLFFSKNAFARYPFSFIQCYLMLQ